MTNSKWLQLDEKAQNILIKNDRGGFTVPTAGLYPYQWNWDSAFAGWGFSTFDIERAWQELESLFAGQWNMPVDQHGQPAIPPHLQQPYQQQAQPPQPHMPPIMRLLLTLS